MKRINDEVAIVATVIITVVIGSLGLYNMAKKDYASRILIEDSFPSEYKVTINPISPNVVEPTVIPTKSLGGEFKSYMDYRKITKKTSKQYALQQIATTDDEGFRKIGRYYCIAMGSHYAKSIGQTFIVELESVSIDCIVADVKDDKDTMDGIYCKENGSIVEFVIDKDKIDNASLRKGNILKFKGDILDIMEEDK